MDLQQTITNIINQNGGREYLSEKLQLEWPELYGLRTREAILLKHAKPIKPKVDRYLQRKHRMLRLLNQQ